MVDYASSPARVHWPARSARGALKSLPGGWRGGLREQVRQGRSSISRRRCPNVTTSDPDPPPGPRGAWFRVRRCRHFAMQIAVKRAGFRVVRSHIQCAVRTGPPTVCR